MTTERFLLKALITAIIMRAMLLTRQMNYKIYFKNKK